jgi:hypothetical protein
VLGSYSALLAYQVRSGKHHHTRRAEKENERKVYILCVGNVASFVQSEPPADLKLVGMGKGEETGTG